MCAVLLRHKYRDTIINGWTNTIKRASTLPV